jgi:hypothetical protein
MMLEDKGSLGPISGRSLARKPEREERGTCRQGDLHQEHNQVQGVYPARQNGIQPQDCGERGEDGDDQPPAIDPMFP